MAELNSKLFRDYFGGSWVGQVYNNGEFFREIEFNLPLAFEKNFSSIGTEEGLKVPAGVGFYDDTQKVAIAGWRQDLRRWSMSWFNEFGGFGEMNWTSCELQEGKNILYGYGHECKQESDGTTDHILKCEMLDQDNFKYSLRSFKKGLIEIHAKRTRTAEELELLMKSDGVKSKSFSN